MIIVEGQHGPGRSDFHYLSLEVAAMLEITPKVTKYRQLLDTSLVGSSFRPRMVEIIGILKFYQEKTFLTGPDFTILGQFEMRFRIISRHELKERVCRRRFRSLETGTKLLCCFLLEFFFAILSQFKKETENYLETRAQAET